MDGIGLLFGAVATIIIAIIFILRVLFAAFSYFRTTEKVNSFSSSSCDEMPGVNIEPKAFEKRVQIGFWAHLLNKVPSVIAYRIVFLVIVFLSGSWFSTKNIEPIASAGAALSTGNISLAATYLVPIGRDITKSQYRISSGNHPTLEKFSLNDRFKFIGRDDLYNYAIMESPVIAGDIDPSLERDDTEYGKVIYGAKPENANDTCEQLSSDIITNLATEKVWDMSQANILVGLNIEKKSDEAEWLYDQDPKDNDRYMINFKKNSDLRSKLIEKGGFKADSKDGIYYDESDVHDFLKVSYRCSAKWP